MKNIACLLLLTLLFAATFNGCRKGDATAKDSQVDTIPMLVMQIKKCSRLYTTEYRVHKIVTYNDVKEFSGEFFSKKFSITFPYTDRKVAIPMDVTLKGYIDFANFSEENVQREGDKITIILPDPRIELTSSKIDQKGITEYVSLVRSHFTDSELSALEQQGREAVIKRIPEMGIRWASSRPPALVPPTSSYPSSPNWATRNRTSPSPSAATSTAGTSALYSTLTT